MRQTRRKKPFSIYPSAVDKAKAIEIAAAEELNMNQVFIRAFRRYAKRWDAKRNGRSAALAR